MPLKVDTVIANSLNTSTLVINGADDCSTSSQLFENIPFIVQPTFTKTCTQITNTIQRKINEKSKLMAGIEMKLQKENVKIHEEHLMEILKEKPDVMIGNFNFSQNSTDLSSNGVDIGIIP